MKKIIKMVFIIIIISCIFNVKYTNKIITKFFGLSVLRIMSGSMEPELKCGDIILIKQCKEYNINDIITFNVDNQYLVTHRIIERQGNDFVTKGDNNNTIDQERVTIDNIEGKMIYNSKFLKFLSDYKYLIIIIFLIILFI